MLETALVAARDRQRLTEILGVVGRYGLGRLAARFGLPGGAALERRDDALAPLSEPARLRMALEALGPTFVKLGQILSTRGDLLAPEWIAELERLQSDVAPEPWERARPRLEAALGAPVETVFARFDATPLASGSIAQVYRARLKGEDGADVVVKLRREGLRARIDADMRLLAHAAALAEARFDAARRHRLGEIVRALSASLREELDFANEGRNAERIARNVAGDAVVVPGVHWAFTSEDVLVIDFVDGAPARDGAAVAALGLDRARLAERGARLFVDMMLRDGEFHADPHPGNLRFLPGERIGLIDFGAIGVVSPRRRREMLTLVAAMAAGDGERIAAILLDWNPQTDVDQRALEADAASFARRHGRAGAGLAALVADFLSLMRARDLAVPPDLALLLKALVSADAAVRAVDPDINLIEAATPHVQRLMAERFGPARLGRRAGAALADLDGLVEEAPGLARAAARLLRRGRLGAEVEVAGLDRLSRAIEGGAARLAVALVAAALTLALAPAAIAAAVALVGAPAASALGALALAGLLLWMTRVGRAR